MLFTDVRKALWDSVDHHEPLKKHIRQTIRFFDKRDPTGTTGGQQQVDYESDDSPTAIHELPCLAMSPSSTIPEMHDNQNHYMPYVMDLSIWTPGWTYDLSEHLWEKWLEAVFANRDKTSKLTFLKKIGVQKVDLNPVTWQRVFLGSAEKVPAVHLRGGLTIRVARNIKVFST